MLVVSPRLLGEGGEKGPVNNNQDGTWNIDISP